MHQVDIVEMEAEIFAVIISVVVLTAQLVLCFKARKLWIRLLPACLCVTAAAASFALTFLNDGWGSVAYMLLMLFCLFLLLVCVLGWGVWAIARECNLRKECKNET